MISSRIEIIAWLLILSTVYCFPADKTNKTEKLACEPDFCQKARFKCVACNGTSVPSKDPCICCPVCENYIEEGDRCTFEEVNLPPEEKATSGDAKTKEIIKTEENVNKGKECRPGLMCLLGTCVTLF